MDKVLLFFALKYAGNWDLIYEALDKKERIDSQELETVESRIDCKYITIINPLYPNNLKNSYKPPFVLFYQGDINLLINYYKIIGIICEEEMSNYSLEQTKKMLTALDEERKTILTLKKISKIDIVCKREIRITNVMKEVEPAENQLIISESYELNLTNDCERLIFGIANFLLVVELLMKNKLFETLKLMGNNNSEIFVIPQQNNSKKLANNWLIKQGAKLIETPFDILNDF